MTPTVLARILQSTRVEVARREQELPRAALEQRIEARAEPAAVSASAGAAESVGASEPRGFRAALSRPGVAVIAEFKRRSPSAGTLRAEPDLAEIVAAYARGGAAALSVLTERPNFGGSLEDLRNARALCELPLLRKDFVVNDYQLLEARDAGADAVLLIVAALTDTELGSLHERARALALDVLVEVHDRAELDRALAVGAETIGVNNRDLRDFSVDVARTHALRGAIPAGVLVVSESGITATAQLRELARERVDAVLVGESLMRAADPAQALRELLSYGMQDGQRARDADGPSAAAAAESEMPRAGFSSPS
ncbi:MAG TPA: indole-3-glycerol phosphate synthase TrpC [Solirubrobacteraceae bacterium]|jgi:indole-3-glycerol phosphate synthase|nr:indole-3-glycerol phosphate synthase TrpC [Solirubrobacteraceae bacterium]